MLLPWFLLGFRIQLLQLHPILVMEFPQTEGDDEVLYILKTPPPPALIEVLEKMPLVQRQY